MRISPLAIVLLSVLSLACDSQSTAPSGAPDAVLNGSPVAPGGLMTLEYTNTSGEAFAVNACRREVEALREGVWVALPPELRLCADDAQVVRAGVVTTIELDVPLFIPDGTYRFKLATLPWPTPNEPSVQFIVTDPFEVKE